MPADHGGGARDGPSYCLGGGMRIPDRTGSGDGRTRSAWRSRGCRWAMLLGKPDSLLRATGLKLAAIWVDRKTRANRKGAKKMRHKEQKRKSETKINQASMS